MRITCYYRFKALFLHLHRPPKDTMHTLKLTTTATFRTFYRTATAALVVAILAMMFLTSQSSNATVTPDPTNNGCIGKNYTVEKYFAYPNNNIDAGELWISIDNNKTQTIEAVSYTHLRAHETVLDLVCRLLLEKKKRREKKNKKKKKLKHKKKKTK